MEWKNLSFILRGKLRRQTLKNIQTPKTATKLAKELKKHRSSVSRTLIELEQKGYAVCLDGEEPYNRHYKATKFGNKIIEELQKIE